ncbi:COP1-interacting protein 7-like [Triticum dicoccoides]|uniref:COP1-interacting protein 7-like n=1 Tax=Triticum dicoccoides TaxID=85692 RepID=UPI00188E5705|nr:COP1-interacting protein 7-like [Triticum dicoccoides]
MAFLQSTSKMAAQDQIAKGGYTILLEPDLGADAPWFTRGTAERFVRLVIMSEVLERVTMIESEILQLEDAIAVQSNKNLGLKSGEGHNGKPVDSSMEGTIDTTDFISFLNVALRSHSIYEEILVYHPSVTSVELASQLGA